MTLRNVHPGGFFWDISRADRDGILRQLAMEVGRLAVITRSDQEADALAERLTLSGLPVYVATDVSRAATVDTFNSDAVSTLVASHDFVMRHGPVRAPLAVHSRVSSSVREYSRRLEAVQSAVHVTLVTPEDAHKASSLSSFLVKDRGHDEVIDITLSDVIDLTELDGPAATARTRRRFPLRG